MSPAKPKPAIDSKSKISMGIFSNDDQKSKMNDDFMYNERFGNYQWKFDNAQGKIFQYTQAEGMARKLDPDA